MTDVTPTKYPQKLDAGKAYIPEDQGDGTVLMREITADGPGEYAPRAAPSPEGNQDEPA